MAKHKHRFSECSFTRWLTLRLKRVGCVVLPIVGNMYTESGWPDRLLIHREFRCFVEFKKDNELLKPHQGEMCKRLMRVGEAVFIGRIRETDFFELQRLSGTTVGQLDIKGLLSTTEKGKAEAGRVFAEFFVESVKRYRQEVDNSARCATVVE